MGDIKELQNAIERSVILARKPVVRIDESLDERADGGPAPESGTLEDAERAHIIACSDKLCSARQNNIRSMRFDIILLTVIINRRHAILTYTSRS